MSFILRKLQGGNLEVFKVSPPPLPSLPLPPRQKSKRPLSPKLSPLTFTYFVLSVRQFGMYILFPIGWMYYFGTNLEERFSVPGFWPTKEQSHKIPTEKEEIDRELARMRMVDALRRERRRELEAAVAAAAAAQTAAGKDEEGSS